MKHHITAAAAALVTTFVAMPASAALLLSVQQATPGDIALGSSAIFNVTIASSPGSTTQVAGIDFVLQANDPGFIGTQTSGGRFTAGTNDLFVPNGGFAMAFPWSFQVFSANAGAEISIGDTPELLATLTLDTTGATAGSYSMVMSSVLAVDARFLTVPLQGAAPLSYTIAARQPATVPEPASGALAVLALLAACTLRRAPPARRG